MHQNHPNDTSADISHIQCICLKDLDKTSFLVHCPFETDISSLNQIFNQIEEANHTVTSIVISTLIQSNDTSLTIWEAITTASTQTLEEITIRHCSADIKDSIISDKPVHELTSVTQLKIENCRLGQIPKLFLTGLPNLEYLSLKDNNIQRLNKEEFSGLNKLNTLDLSENVIHAAEESSLSTLPNLETLYIGDHNNLTAGLKDEIVNITSLKQVSFAKADEIYSLADFKFSSDNKIERIDLSGCGVTNITNGDFQNLTTLEYVDLSVNLIEKLGPRAFESASNLQYISLAGNFLNETNLEEDSWIGLDKLVHLDLGYNEFTTFNNNFHNLKHLKSLNLRSNNRLFSLDKDSFNGLSGLETLNLTGSSVKYIDNNAFKGMDNIQTLDLSSNKISQLNTPFEVIGRSLNNLNLSSNHLTNINATTLNGLKNLTVLDISQNPLKCNLKILDLQLWITNEYKRATTEGRPFYLAKPELVICDEPEHLKGRELMEVTADMINNIPTTTIALPTTPDDGETTTLTFDLSKWSANIGEANGTLLKDESSDADKPKYDINSIRYGQRQPKTQTPTTWVTVCTVVFLVMVTIVGVIYVVRRKKTNLVHNENSISQGISSSL
ncbi:unnamed protein product [Bursaphelenchus xylophilus]|uniref:(pine wood nematode) hypothetical protein n=1 Tax=Bursaphelenchus xylophilus TaxID=6326 RepID=A0A7I8XL83_BURXY|nr:unnamed protein product [Bursaphelenchus xylophilus]CAG9086608.1 unnamed protein product [Bursaphelenchus xylophilus]